MANLSNIRELCIQKNITLKELSEEIGISQNGLQRILKDNSTRIDTLEKIASFFEVPITYFFQDDEEGVSETVELKTENENLKKRIAELEEELLEDKRTIVKFLTDQGSPGILSISKKDKDGNIDITFRMPNGKLINAKEITPLIDKESPSYDEAKSRYLSDPDFREVSDLFYKMTLKRFEEEYGDLIDPRENKLK